MRNAFNYTSFIYGVCGSIFCCAVAHSSVADLFATAEQDGRVGLARKSKPVDVRPARPGEIIVTTVAGEKETQSPPAKAGDMVVRNRCRETGNEEILVGAAKFNQRYEGPIRAAGPDGWRTYRPRGIEMLYFILRDADGSFDFEAPWGESMIARPGDAIVRDPQDVKDTYRIEAAAFACTYEILRSAAPAVPRR